MMNPKYEVRESTPPTLEEAQEFVDGYVEMVSLADGSQLLINEEGKLFGKPYNAEATNAAYNAGNNWFGTEDVIVGNAWHLKEKARWLD
tara:strand:- start:116 stop:382 length:267 start_codon:yes stop_codon:yes gene_type:complete